MEGTTIARAVQQSQRRRGETLLRKQTCCDTRAVGVDKDETKDTYYIQQVCHTSQIATTKMARPCYSCAEKDKEHAARLTEEFRLKDYQNTRVTSENVKSGDKITWSSKCSGGVLFLFGLRDVQ